MRRRIGTSAVIALAFALAQAVASAATIVSHPFAGVTHFHQTETAPAPAHATLSIHVIAIDLSAPGLRFKLTAPSGTRETIRQRTLDYLKQEQAQIAVNAHFFLPYPSTDTEAWLVGFAASEGRVYSAFENPEQSYAIVARAPALNISRDNQAAIVHWDSAADSGTRLKEPQTPWTALAGSAQIITAGRKTIPTYSGPGDEADPNHPQDLLQPNKTYSNAHSWYALRRARTIIGLSQDRRTLFLFTVDGGDAGGEPGGMSVADAADLLIQQYKVYDALNLDGGGSTTLAMQDPATGIRQVVNAPTEGPAGRAVGSNLAVFASVQPAGVPASARAAGGRTWGVIAAACLVVIVSQRGLIVSRAYAGEKASQAA